MKHCYNCAKIKNIKEKCDSCYNYYCFDCYEYYSYKNNGNMEDIEFFILCRECYNNETKNLPEEKMYIIDKNIIKILLKTF